MREIRYRCWIDIDGEKFFGPGPAQLLSLIDEKGSIAKAAKQMGMSYKKAWDMVQKLNTKGSSPFVIPQKGGKKGGGAELTDSGKAIIEKYNELLIKLDAVIQQESELIQLI